MSYDVDFVVAFIVTVYGNCKLISIYSRDTRNSYTILDVAYSLSWELNGGLNKFLVNCYYLFIFFYYLFINNNTITNYILIIYELSNFDHVLGVVS